MSPPDRLPTTRALIDMLAAEIEHPVFNTQADPDAVMPYVVVHDAGTASYSGPPFADPEGDVQWVYQVDSVGEGGDEAGFEQVTLLADRVRTAILGRTGSVFATAILPADGSVVTARWFDSDGGVDVGVRLVSKAERYVLAVTRP